MGACCASCGHFAAELELGAPEASSEGPVSSEIITITDDPQARLGSAMNDILTITMNPALDRCVSTDAVEAQAKLRCRLDYDSPGGGGINVARVVAALGGRVEAVFTAGGTTGHTMTALLRDQGIDAIPIPVSATTRTNLTAYDRRHEREYRFVLPGEAISEEEMARVLTHMERRATAPDYLVLSGSLPPGLDTGFYARLSRLVPATTRVILDSSGESLKQALDSGIYLIKPNLRELDHLAGQAVEDDRSIIAASRRLIAVHGLEVVMTSLGAGGVIVVTADRVHHVRAPTVRRRSTIGAGDSSVAGLVLALARGSSLAEASRCAVAAGAAAVMTAGHHLLDPQDYHRLVDHGLDGADDETVDDDNAASRR